jgi:hypothetical protein
VNRQGHPPSLVAQQFENKNALRLGVYSPRHLASRAQEVRDALLAAPAATSIDQIGAEEIGSLVATLEAIDKALAERPIRATANKGDGQRRLLEDKDRLSGRLLRWLREYGATPASRLALVESLARANAVAPNHENNVAEGMRLLEHAARRGDLPTAESEGDRG